MAPFAANGELLPPGVGRVPTWWMECTPHYTLDVDDEEARQMAEDQMAFYYMQLAAADDAGILGPDGKPKLDANGKPMEFAGLAGWAGRGIGSSSHHGPITFGGRTFKPGQAVIDPSLFGISKSDPNYHAYLTGAKLPPGYFETMADYVKDQNKAGNPYGILNNQKQTDYGRYGRQAEKPAFQPDWIKKKLRKTSTGAACRSGQYDDSPNKFVELPSILNFNKSSRRISPKEDSPDVLDPTPAKVVAAWPPPDPVVDPEPLSYYSEEEPPTLSRVGHSDAQSEPDPMVAPKSATTPSAGRDVEQESTVEVISAVVTVVDDDGVQRRKRIVRKVRRVRMKDSPSLEIPESAPISADAANQLEQLQRRKAELLALQQQAAEEQRLRELQAHKDRLLEQKRLAELEVQKMKQEAEQEAAAEALRKKKAEKMRLLQLQAAAEEAELQRKKREEDEAKLRKLQLEKMKLLQLQKAKEEAERLQKQKEEETEAEEARRKLQLEKMKLLQLQKAKEEAERLKQQKEEEEAAAAEAARRKAQLEKMKQLQLQAAKKKAEEEEAARVAASIAANQEKDDLAEKLRRLEELKELKRQQDLAEAAAVAERMNQEAANDEGTYYEEETLVTADEETIEEIVEEEEGTIEEIIDEDEDYTMEEETYIEDQSIEELQAILAAKQAELAKLQTA